MGNWAYSRAIVIVFGLFFIGTLGLDQEAFAATISSAQSGDWNVGSTWVGGLVPLPADDVIIEPGHTVTLDDSAVTINSLIIRGSPISVSQLNVGSVDAATLTITESGGNDEFEVRTRGTLTIGPFGSVFAIGDGADLDVFGQPSPSNVFVNGGLLDVNDKIFVHNGATITNDCTGRITLGNQMDLFSDGTYVHFGILTGPDPNTLIPTEFVPPIPQANNFNPPVYADPILGGVYLPQTGVCGVIDIIKDVVDSPDATDFSFTTTGGLSPATFDLDDDADGTLSNSKLFSVDPATFTVTETATTGYTLTDLTCVEDGTQNSFETGSTATINVEAGESVTCTFTNDDTPPQTGNIIIEKVTDSFTETTGTGFGFDHDSSLTCTGVNCLSGDRFALDTNPGTAVPTNSQTFTGVTPGSYSITEDLHGSFTQSLTCDDGASSVPSTIDNPTRTATVNVEADETVTCTFTNISLGSVTITKNTNPQDPQDFGFTGDFGIFQLDDDGEEIILPSSAVITFVDTSLSPFTVTEDDPSLVGYSLENLVCDDGASSVPSTVDIPNRIATINLEPGEHVTCTFFNEPTPLATINIVKEAAEADQDFGFTDNIEAPNAFTLNDAGIDTESFQVPIGSYSVSEDDPSGLGYDLTDVSCENDGGSAVGVWDNALTVDITINTVNDFIVCTFTNEPIQGTFVEIDSISEFEGDSGTTDFEFTLTRTGDLSGPSSVDFNTFDIDAEDENFDGDYQSSSGTVDFLALETTKTVTILVNGDEVPEFDETFGVALGNCIGCETTSTPGQGIGTIVNDDNPCLDAQEDGESQFFGGDFILGLLVPEQFRAYGGVSEISFPPCADLSIDKTVDNFQPSTGDFITYTITISNAGPDDATGVIADELFPSDFLDFDTFGVISPGVGVSCFVGGPNEGECTINIANIPAGTSKTIEIIYEVIEDNGRITNTAEIVFANEFDPDSEHGNGVIGEDDDASLTIFKSREGGYPYPRPNLGDRKHGAGHDNGFCMDGNNCVNVRNLLTHFPEVVVAQGTTHTFSFIVDCQRGSLTCNHVTFGGAIPGTDFYDMQWKVILDRNPRTGEWTQQVINEHGEISDTVTSILNDITQTFLSVDINVLVTVPGSFGTPDGVGIPHEHNRHLRFVVSDNQGGTSNYIFNDGIFVQDIYAYPQVETSFESPLEYDRLCLNEDPTKRYTCAFDKVRDWTIRQAEDKLKQLYDEKGKDMDSYDESEQY